MELGLVGLGKMGGNMRERLRRAGHTVVGYDRNPDVSDVDSLEAMVAALPTPKVVWVMVPHGGPTHDTAPPADHNHAAVRASLNTDGLDWPGQLGGSQVRPNGLID